MADLHPDVHSLLDEWDEHDSVAVCATLSNRPDPVDTMALVRSLVRHCYWTRKDLPRVVMVARCGIQLGLDRAAALERADDASTAHAVRSEVKALCYDLASFTWPGWEEDGVLITINDTTIGLDAARANVRLADELDKGDLARSRAQWMLGGQLLEAGDYDGAAAAYREGVRLAEAADSPADALSSTGFVRLIGAARGAVLDLDDVVAGLREVEHGQMYIDQLSRAARVYLVDAPDE